MGRLRSGGWIIILATLVFALAAYLQISTLLRNKSAPRPGDGTNPDTYGFDLTTCVVDRDYLVGCGLPKDSLRPLAYPPLMRPDEEAIPRRGGHGGKYLVSQDRVIGVTIDGVARAYPIRVLAWHEVVNDTLAGVPIAITYSPLCDASVVFDRRLSGEVVEFGVSGLLFNANLVLYDRRDDPATESLWSQLQTRAIAGPAAEEEMALTIVPFAVMHWADWVERYPHTLVVRPDLEMTRQYRTEPYGSYYGNDLLPAFPVAVSEDDPAADAGGPGLANKTPVLFLRGATPSGLSPDSRRVYPIAVLNTRADDAGIAVVVNNESVDVDASTRPDVAWIDYGEAANPMTADPDRWTVVGIPTLWFALRAMYPDLSLPDGVNIPPDS